MNKRIVLTIAIGFLVAAWMGLEWYRTDMRIKHDSIEREKDRELQRDIMNAQKEQKKSDEK